MEENILATTTLERMPPEFRGSKPKRTSAWVILVIIGILLMGSYEFYAYMKGTQQVAPDAQDRASTPANKSVDELQAAVNIAIPDFSKNF